MGGLRDIIIGVEKYCEVKHRERETLLRKKNQRPRGILNNICPYISAWGRRVFRRRMVMRQLVKGTTSCKRLLRLSFSVNFPNPLLYYLTSLLFPYFFFIIHLWLLVCCRSIPTMHRRKNLRDPGTEVFHHHHHHHEG